MTTRRRNIKLGLFIVLSAAVIAALLVAFLGVGLTAGARYYVFTEDAEGLDVSVPVKLRGVRIGRVTDLQLVSDGRHGVRVELQVDEDARIPADARAYLELAGVSGLKLVNIRGGSASAPSLPPESEIPLGETTLDKLRSEGENLLARANDVLDSTNRLLNKLDRTADTISPEQVDQTLKETQKLVSVLKRTAVELNRIVAQSREPLRRTLGSADELARRTDTVLQNLDSTLSEVRGLVRQNDDDLRATVDNLREASQGFKSLSQELRRQPNRLLFGGAPPERELP